MPDPTLVIGHRSSYVGHVQQLSKQFIVTSSAKQHAVKVKYFF